MKIVELREVKSFKDVTVGRICDECKKQIEPVDQHGRYDYFLVTTHHDDWGRDSVDSYESYDACCVECATVMFNRYIQKASCGYNTMAIEVEHVRSINDGTDRVYEKKLGEY